MPRNIKAFKSRRSVTIDVWTKRTSIGGVLTNPRPNEYTDEMLSNDMRAARQAMMAAHGTTIVQARKDLKNHIDHIHNQRTRI